MNAEQVILSRGLPKTGQTSMAYPRDDGVFEAGWWVGRKNADNKERFITKTLNGDDVVIDLATGLMWAADGDAAGCNNGNTLSWTGGLSYTQLLNFAGFNDWRIPNIFELFSIVDCHRVNPTILQPPFENTQNNYYWASTTFYANQAKALAVFFNNGIINGVLKIATWYIRCVRGGV